MEHSSVIFLACVAAILGASAILYPINKLVAASFAIAATFLAAASFGPATAEKNLYDQIDISSYHKCVKDANAVLDRLYKHTNVQRVTGVSRFQAEMNVLDECIGK